ncbi:MAG: cation:proton antiporter [Candidatus Eisenbacteria bacterium]
MAFAPELVYVALLFALFVLPKLLQRFSLPAAITSFALGAAAGLGAGMFVHDTTLTLLASFGITALFLFAGLEVDIDTLRDDAVVLSQHLVIRAALLASVGWLAVRFAGLETRPAIVLALALLTPSTGFILDSLASLGLGTEERRWVKSKAIATELLALLVMFATLQSTSVGQLALSTASLAAIVVVLPVLFRWFARFVVPHAPRSEFAFLLMMAVLCAYATRALGVYYLVGAFVVGVAAQRFRRQIPAFASEQMIHAVEMFASVFVPFYFFGAGLHVRREDLSAEAIGWGAGFVLTMLPLRLLAVTAHRRFALREHFGAGLRVAIPMLPTLVFGLVLAGILRDRYEVRPAIVGGVTLYTVIATLVPSLLFRRALASGTELHAPETGSATPLPGGGDQ